jgi:putative redox protein
MAPPEITWSFVLVRIDISYEGDLHCQARHAPSGKQLETDAPVDNHGRGESFSPTDLLATSLGTCMLTTMGILAKQRGLSLAGVRAYVVKHMTKAQPRRVERLEAAIWAPAATGRTLDAAARAALEERAHHCPVRLSLLPAVEVPIAFTWEAAEGFEPAPTP